MAGFVCSFFNLVSSEFCTRHVFESFCSVYLKASAQEYSGEGGYSGTMVREGTVLQW